MLSRLTASGYNIAREKCPYRRPVMKSLESEVSTPQSGNAPDYVVDLLKEFNLPVTRESYLGLAYPEGVPEDLDEMTLPPQIRQA
jgi:hypothetical protein